MNRQMGGGIDRMCNLAEGVYQFGVSQGISQERYNIIVSLLETTDFAFDEVIALLRISNQEDVQALKMRLLNGLEETDYGMYLDSKPTTITYNRIIDRVKEN